LNCKDHRSFQDILHTNSTGSFLWKLLVSKDRKKTAVVEWKTTYVAPKCKWHWQGMND